MRQLNKNWITEHHIDFEYKKYVLLAYLQHVSGHFTEQRLYPYLADLIEHYRDLRLLKDNKDQLYQQFPERLNGARLEEFRLVYEKLVRDDHLMQELNSIIDFSLPQMEQALRDGKKIYDFVEEHCRIFPVGLVPLNKDAGYIFLRSGETSETVVYEYHLSLFEGPHERFRGIHVGYVTTYEKGLMNTYESIKTDLLRFHRRLPNPAAYVIESDFKVPFDETFLPIAKRALVRALTAAA
jgi:hypothetical protein